MHAKDLAVWVSDWSIPSTPMPEEAAAFAETGGEYQNYTGKEETPRAASVGERIPETEERRASTQRLVSQEAKNRPEAWEARGRPEVWASRSGAQ